MAVSVEGLASAVKGRVVEAGAPDYDESRALYNAMIDKRPAAIAYCADEADVAAAVRYGVEHGLRIAVRGGGHNGGGLGSVDDGLVIDLSQMNAIERRRRREDGPRRRRRAAQGRRSTATHEHGLTVPVGIIGTTGVGGLTLGGGIGHLTRALGLTIDNLVAATVVLADGSVVQTDAEREPELFWALRGGGGNFGVVTSFSFRCHPVTTVLAGPVLYDIGRHGGGAGVVSRLPAARPTRSAASSPSCRCRRGRRSRRSCTCARCAASSWTQAGEEESDALREARSFGKPLLDGIAPVPLPAWNTAFDARLPAGRPVVLARRVRPGDLGRGDRRARRVRPGAADVEVDDAPVRDRRRRRPGSGTTRRRGRTGTRCGRGVFAGVDPDPANAGAIRDWARRVLRRDQAVRAWAAATSTSRWTSRTACAACTARTTTGSHGSRRSTTRTTSSGSTRTSRRRLRRALRAGRAAFLPPAPRSS